MTVDYPLPIWKSLAPTNFTDENATFENLHPLSPRAQKVSEGGPQPSNAFLFVLFVKLPIWKLKNSDSRELTPEIRTLRNLKNGIEVYRVKAALELSTGLPAHVTYLLDMNDKKLSDNTRLVIGENVRSGSSLRLQVISAWEDVINAACTNDLPSLLANLPAKKDQKDVASADYKEFASVVAKSGNEHAFCALFVAAAKGNIDVCKAILEAGYDPNQATFFGNSSLHSAAHNGQFEVIQLLLSHRAYIRCINSQKKTPLDIAASCGYIDCARWLWLNQWSVSIPKEQENESADKNKKPPAIATSPSKPLQECSTLFTKPEAPTLSPTSVAKSKTLSATKPSLLRDNLNVPVTEERPQSSPFSWRLNKLENRASFSKNNKFQTYAETKRPFTAAARKTDRNLSPESPRLSSKSPRLLPQISANIYRGRSIPSVHETRYQRPSNSRLRVDIQTRSFVKPVSIHMPLTGHWINPEPTFVGLASTNPELPDLKNEQQPLENNSPRNQTHTPNTIKYSSLSSVESEQSRTPITPPSKFETTALLTDSAKTNAPSKLQDFNEVTPTATDIKVSFVSAKSNSESLKLADDQLLNKTDKTVFFKKNSSIVNLSKPPSNEKQQKSLFIDANPSILKQTNSIPNEKLATSNLDSYDSLHSGGSQVHHSVTREEKKMLPNSVAQARTFIVEKGKKAEAFHVLTSQASKSPQPKPSPVKEKVYDRYERDDSKTESKKSQALTRDQEIRKERNKTAWAEWKAAKHNEKVAQKKKQEEAKKQQNNYAARKWGMTFEEWLGEKKKEAEKKTEEPETIQTTQKKPHVVTSGKTFEDWLKGKQEEKLKESKTSEQKPSEEQLKKAEEARQRSFAIWSAKKLEEAKREKEKREKEQETEKSSLTMTHDKWRSKERVMSFDAWKKKKEKARKLQLVDQVQEEEKEYLAILTAEQRKEDAEKAFRKWMNRKHSIMLQEAANELEEAKIKRENTEKKLKLRRALLRAKVLLRWERMAKTSSKLNRRQSSRLMSMSLSTGDIADATIPSDDEKVLQEFLKNHSEDETDNFSPKQNFRSLGSQVIKNGSKNKTRRSQSLKERTSRKKSQAESTEQEELPLTTLGQPKPLRSRSSSSNTTSSSSDSELSDRNYLNRKKKRIPKRKKAKKIKSPRSGTEKTAVRRSDSLEQKLPQKPSNAAEANSTTAELTVTMHKIVRLPTITRTTTTTIPSSKDKKPTSPSVNLEGQSQNESGLLQTQNDRENLQVTKIASSSASLIEESQQEIVEEQLEKSGLSSEKPNLFKSSESGSSTSNSSTSGSESFEKSNKENQKSPKKKVRKKKQAKSPKFLIPNSGEKSKSFSVDRKLTPKSPVSKATKPPSTQNQVATLKAISPTNTATKANPKTKKLKPSQSPSSNTYSTDSNNSNEKSKADEKAKAKSKEVALSKPQNKPLQKSKDTPKPKFLLEETSSIASKHTRLSSSSLSKGIASSPTLDNAPSSSFASSAPSLSSPKNMKSSSSSNTKLQSSSPIVDTQTLIPKNPMTNEITNTAGSADKSPISDKNQAVKTVDDALKAESSSFSESLEFLSSLSATENAKNNALTEEKQLNVTVPTQQNDHLPPSTVQDKPPIPPLNTKAEYKENSHGERVPKSASGGASKDTKPQEKVLISAPPGKVSVDYGGYKIDVGGKNKNRIQNPLVPKAQSEEKGSKTKQKEFITNPKHAQEKSAENSKLTQNLKIVNTLKNQNNSEKPNLTSIKGKSNSKTEKLIQIQDPPGKKTDAFNHDDAITLNGISAPQVEKKNSKKERKNKTSKVESTHKENRETTPKNSKPSTPKNTTAEDQTRIKEKRNGFSTSAYSLVQAALDFIEKQEADEAAVQENAESVSKRKITIEMPVAGVEDPEDSANENSS